MIKEVLKVIMYCVIAMTAAALFHYIAIKLTK